MKTYTVSLPSYTIGEDAYKSIPEVCKFYGKNAVVIGGKIAMQKTHDFLLKGVENSQINITDFIWYGGDASYANGDKLINDERVKNADMLFVVGGGRACDCGKYVADVLEKPVFTFPTVASNCASVTQICVMYNEDGSFCNYYYPKKLANHAFINSAVIADSPEKLLWAGIGDALSKECEVIFSSKYADLFHTTLMGRQMSRICTSPLLTYGKKALDDIKAKKPSFELDQVTLDIIISTGIVSNLTTTADDYYYNSSIAHMVYNGTTVTKNAHNHLHGEVVSLGVLCLLTFDKNFEERDKIMKFNASVGLPVCFGDIEVEQSDFEAIAEKATKTTEWAHRAPEANITKETLIACMKETDECGKKFKKENA